MNIRFKHLVILFVSMLLPGLGFTEDTSTLSFTPPPSDESVMYLGNIFGVVDGVLHGTGSQIMGAMLGVFNAAVLALGGIVIMYIILVSTMNTAHEGNMLGQKWSSIWVPIRATMGLSLLFPKASGYCLMQIFVMWVVVQGVGVADKIWGAALDYLNRGGVIIKANLNPDTSTWTGSSDSVNSLANGAAKILYAQTCMAGLQSVIESQRDYYLSLKDKNSGPCYGDLTKAMDEFCSTSVPDFINTVDPIAAYDTYASTPSVYEVPMPNFTDGSIYTYLNKICGTLKWNPMSSSQLSSIGGISTVSKNDLQIIEKSRAAAVGQLYISLSMTAREMVNNDPELNGNGASENDASLIAEDQFGIALTSNQAVCATGSDECPSWGADTEGSATYNKAPVLLQGSELQDAIADYNAVMAPVMNLLNAAQNSNKANDERKFIEESKQAGWISAGRYFFDLVELNGSGTASKTTDTDSGVGATDFTINLITEAFKDSTNCNTESKYVQLCELFNKNVTRVQYVVDLINGSSVVNGGVEPVSNFSKNSLRAVTGPGSSTVFGYVHNSLVFDLPAQELKSYSAQFDMLAAPDWSATSAFSAKYWSSAGEDEDTSTIASGAKQGTSTVVSGATQGASIATQGALIAKEGGMSAAKQCQPGVKECVSSARQGISSARQGVSSLQDFQVPSLPEWSNAKEFVAPTLKSARHKATSWGGYLTFLLDYWWRYFWKPFMDMMYAAMELAVQALYYVFIYLPIQGFVYIFKEGISVIGTPGVNPVVALAKMGVAYINFSMDLWIITTTAVVVNTLNFFIGPILYGIIMLLMPLFLSWLTIMVGIGYSTAYFVPLYPYLIFTFGTVAWLITVIEAMVAAPIVALGIAHPEGHDALGKSETAFMILLNVFLRPGMMIIGYIAGISLSYVSVWILNAGYTHVVDYLMSSQIWGSTSTGSITKLSWASIFGFFFSALSYAMIYMVLVDKAFTLIAVLPDKVLRWIGGAPESAGQETLQWAGDIKSKVSEAGTKTHSAGQAMQRQVAGKVEEGVGTAVAGVKAMMGGGGVESGGAAPPAAGGEGGGGGSNTPSTNAQQGSSEEMTGNNNE